MKDENKKRSQQLVPATMTGKRYQTQRWQRKVIIDLHGVIKNWVKEFVAFVYEKTGIKLAEEQAIYYFWYDGNSPLLAEVGQELFHEFALLNKNGYGNLEDYPGARQALQAINRLKVEYEVWSYTPGAIEQSVNHGIPYGSGTAQATTIDMLLRDDVIKSAHGLEFMHGLKKPREMSNQMIPILIEDDPVTAAMARGHYGLAVIVIDHRYNRCVSGQGIVRVPSLKEAVQVVKQMMQELEDKGVLEAA